MKKYNVSITMNSGKSFQNIEINEMVEHRLLRGYVLIPEIGFGGSGSEVKQLKLVHVSCLHNTTVCQLKK